MRKNKNEVRCKRMNLLEAEVYVRFPISTIGDKQVKQYVELQEETTQNGIREHYVAVDYPITPESVNSYADSADYRKNPDVIKNAVHRQNLGDVSEVQKVMSNDMTEMRLMFAKMQEVMKKVEDSQNPKKDPVPPVEPVEPVEKGVEKGGVE